MPPPGPPAVALLALRAALGEADEDAAPGLFGGPPSDPSCKSRESTDADTVSGGLAAMGTLLVIGASFISCLGTNLQKLSHNHNESLPLEERKPMHKSGRWWLGIICMILGSLMDMAALPFVPMSRVAALGASGMVANVMVTPVFLKERLTKHDLLGGAVIVMGTTLTCTFGAGREPTITSECLLQYFAAKLFIFYAIVFVVFCLGLLFLIEGFRRMQRKAVQEGIIVQTLETIWAHEHKELLRTIPADKTFVYIDKFGPQFYPVVHAVYAGAVGACSVMFAKLAITFLGNAMRGQDVGNSVALVFLFLVPTVLCVWNQIRFLNFALKIYRDALFVLPVYQAVWIAAGIMAGLIFYQEYVEIATKYVAGFAMGIIVSFVGIVILARRKSKTPQRAGLPSPGSSPRHGYGSGETPRAGAVMGMQDRPVIEYSDDWRRRLDVCFTRPLAPAVEDYFSTPGTQLLDRPRDVENGIGKTPLAGAKASSPPRLRWVHEGDKDSQDPQSVDERSQRSPQIVHITPGGALNSSVGGAEDAPLLNLGEPAVRRGSSPRPGGRSRPAQDSAGLEGGKGVL